MSFPNYDNIKSEMVAEKSRGDIEMARQMGISACPNKGLVIELYTGRGGLTGIYRERFNEVVTNDINPKSIATHHFSALHFIKTLVPLIEQKIDMIDFDCYGCPTEEIKAFFALRQSDDSPIIVALSDGLGVWMKQRKQIEILRARYMLSSEFKFDERHPWREHPRLITEFLTNLGAMYGLKVECIYANQLRFKNYTVGSWKFYK